MKGTLPLQEVGPLGCWLGGLSTSVLVPGKTCTESGVGYCSGLFVLRKKAFPPLLGSDPRWLLQVEVLLPWRIGCLFLPQPRVEPAPSSLRLEICFCGDFAGCFLFINRLGLHFTWKPYSFFFFNPSVTTELN